MTLSLSLTLCPLLFLRLSAHFLSPMQRQSAVGVGRSQQATEAEAATARRVKLSAQHSVGRLTGAEREDPGAKTHICLTHAHTDLPMLL